LSIKSGPPQPGVIELGPLDESSTAYVSPTCSGREQHNVYVDRPDMERAKQRHSLNREEPADLTVGQDYRSSVCVLMWIGDAGQ
jgi:hypothetical protein